MDSVSPIECAKSRDRKILSARFRKIYLYNLKFNRSKEIIRINLFKLKRNFIVSWVRLSLSLRRGVSWKRILLVLLILRGLLKKAWNCWDWGTTRRKSNLSWNSYSWIWIWIWMKTKSLPPWPSTMSPFRNKRLSCNSWPNL